MPGPNVPFPPMEAELVAELPAGGRWQYEPKWDGFRGVLENDGGELALWSRNARPLLRYFPELRPLGDLLPPHSALDGEIVIESEGRLNFEAMQLRLHPAESRIRKLSAEIPATFIAFDVLLWKGEPIHRLPLEERRPKLEELAKGFLLSPYTRDAEVAQGWLGQLEAIGLDGVVAKRLGIAYLPGSREGVVKVKQYKTADCVIVGYRGSERRIHTLLLGVYDEEGALQYVGHAAAAESLQPRLRELLLPLRAPELEMGRAPGGESRWSRGRTLEWNAVRPEIVCEVRYDKLEGDQIRHGAGFLRFRPDKDPRQCTFEQLRPPPKPDELSVRALLVRSRAP